MKVKIKGLVFVGFAAAILSANAMAATTDANTVTSKAYTEATYQHKSTKASIGGADGTWTDLATVIPSNPTNADANTAPSTKAVAEAFNDLAAGLDVNSNLQAEKYVTIEDITENDEVVGHKVVLTGTEITDTGTTLSTASDNLVTENVIAAAVDAKLNHNLGANNADKILVINAQGEVVPSGETGANTYQSKSTDATLPIADGLGGWTTLKTKVNDGTYVEAAEDTNTKALTVDIKDSQIAGDQAAVTSGTTQLTTAAGVKGYAVKIAQGSEAANKTLVTDAAGNVTVSSMASSPLPAKPAECTDATPCALVADATGGIHWVQMAQPE